MTVCLILLTAAAVLHIVAAFDCVACDGADLVLARILADTLVGCGAFLD